MKTEKSGINSAWHKMHRMPVNATIDEKIAWHLEHTKHCGCRKIPGKLKQEIEKRKIKLFE